MPTTDELDQQLSQILNDDGRPTNEPATAEEETQSPEEENHARPEDTSIAVDGLAGPDDDLDRWRELEPVEEQDGKRRLVVNNWAVAFDRLLGQIGAEELAGIFLRSGELVHTPRIGEDGYIEPEHGDDGPAQVQPVTAGQLAAKVDIAFAVGVWVKNRENPKRPDWVSKLVPRDVVNRVYDAARAGMQATALRQKMTGDLEPDDIEALARGPALRELRMVTHTPMLRADGSILDRPGYDDRTRALFLPDVELIGMPKVAPNLAHVNLYEARDRLLDLTADFPWVSDDDRANWYGLLFTPLMRAMFPPPYLMGMITAPNPRSGKSLLAKILEMVHGGVRRKELPRNEEALSKALISTLLTTTAPVVTFDNVRGSISSSTLEGLLSNTEITDRYLGQTRDVTVKNDRIWIMTGNNAAVAGDLGPRILPIQIDPKVPNPERRSFATDLYEFVPRHRGEILVDLLTIIRAWVLDGAPTEQDRSDEYGGGRAPCAGSCTGPSSPAPSAEAPSGPRRWFGMRSRTTGTGSWSPSPTCSTGRLRSRNWSRPWTPAGSTAPPGTPATVSSWTRNTFLVSWRRSSRRSPPGGRPGSPGRSVGGS
jgi:hypothetical protein